MVVAVAKHLISATTMRIAVWLATQVTALLLFAIFAIAEHKANAAWSLMVVVSKITEIRAVMLTAAVTSLEMAAMRLVVVMPRAAALGMAIHNRPFVTTRARAVLL